jgi:ribonuclease P protein component
VTTRYTLGKTERLKSRKAIDHLFEKGQRFKVGALRVYFLPTQSKGLRAGVAVSSKNFSKAVDRNRIKRLLRETYRLQKNLVAETLPTKKGLDLFFVYTEKELPEFLPLKTQMEKALLKINHLLGNA